MVSTPFTRGKRAEGVNKVPVDTVFDVLSNERRRHLLYYLVEIAQGEATVDELVDHLHASPTETRRRDRRAVLAELHHHHLPKLEGANVVTFDGEAVRYRRIPLMEECLARVAGRDLG